MAAGGRIAAPTLLTLAVRVDERYNASRRKVMEVEGSRLHNLGEGGFDNLTKNCTAERGNWDESSETSTIPPSLEGDPGSLSDESCSWSSSGASTTGAGGEQRKAKAGTAQVVDAAERLQAQAEAVRRRRRDVAEGASVQPGGATESLLRSTAGSSTGADAGTTPDGPPAPRRSGLAGTGGLPCHRVLAPSWRQCSWFGKCPAPAPSQLLERRRRYQTATRSKVFPDILVDVGRLPPRTFHPSERASRSSGLGAAQEGFRVPLAYVRGQSLSQRVHSCFAGVRLKVLQFMDDLADDTCSP